MTDLGVELRCPTDRSTLEPVAVDSGVTFICRNCRGIWLPGELVNALAAPFRNGWVGLSVAEDERPGHACPDDDASMTAFQTGLGVMVVEHCGRCGGLWLLGATLQERNDRAGGIANYFEPFPFVPEVYLIKPAALAAGLRPDVVHGLLEESAAAWVR
jgi:Zn-finger nucleic acid-binding protein